MIHIATAHHREARWIPIQLRALARHTSADYRLYGYLHGVAPELSRGFDHVLDLSDSPEGLSNVESMTRLGEVMVGSAEPEDVIVFMHGDTIPVADWTPVVRGLLDDAPLAAVQRRENMEPVPHECFCVTTAGYWEEIGGRFGKGPEWESDGRMVTDTAAALWKIVEDRGDGWTPILRTNAKNLHPVWFAIYGDIVYHHGAGFREPMSRRDAADYSHLPSPMRKLAGLRRRAVNTRLKRRIYKRVADESDDFPRELMEG